ncbi:fibroblast growth factor 19 [Arapaima gigas]
MRSGIGASLVLVDVLFAVEALCAPLVASGPHVASGWGQVVRLRHLYSTRQGENLQITGDGAVNGSRSQSLHSLLEIRSFDWGLVAIKGVASSFYLCMEESGRLYGSHTFTRENCSFRECIMPDGYSVYVLARNGVAVRLSRGRQRPQVRDKGLTLPSLFLPMVSTISLEPLNVHQRDPVPGDPVGGPASPIEPDSMDPFGKMSQVFIHSPSFSKR